MGEKISEQEATKRAYALSKILRCPVCQGLNVADSRSDAAVAMKKRIYELVEMGYSEEQIIDYFTDRYGDWVLLKPKSEHWMVWMVPGALLMLGFGGIVLYFRSQKKEPSSGKKEPETTLDLSKNSKKEDDYRQKILSELEDD